MVPIVSTDTDFRNWGKGVSDAFTAVGFVKATDTGQVDWATQTKPVSVSTYPCYEIRRFNDSLQSTYPVYVKVEYGCGTVASYPALRLTVGKSTDGAGTIGGVLIAAIALTTGSSSSTASNSYTGSGDGSLIHYSPAIGTYHSTATSTSFVLERSRTADGTATGAGLFFGYRFTSTPSFACVNYATGASIAQPRFPAAVPGGGVTLTASGKVPVFAAVVGDGAGNWWQPRSVLAVAQPDASTLVPVSIPGWNTYLATGTWPAMDMFGSGTTVQGMLAWW